RQSRGPPGRHNMKKPTRRDALLAIGAVATTRAKAQTTLALENTPVSDVVQALASGRVTVRTQLLAGTWRPQPVRRVEIPKASGGTHALGIPRCSIASSSKRCCRCCKP